MTSPVWPAPASGTRWLLRLPNWIGDAVMVLPALRALPRDQQTWMGVAHERVLPLYRATGMFDALHAARGARAPLELRTVARGYAPDRAVVFTEALSGSVLARVSGARLRLARGGRWQRTLVTHCLPPATRRRSHWRELLDLAKAAGGTAPASPDFRIALDDAITEKANGLLGGSAQSSPVALAPGAAYGPAKRWPLARFLELSEALRANGERVVIVGGPGERELGARLRDTGAVDLTGQTDLMEAVAVLARCSVLVTNDSGALHLGRAAGIRVVALFGSSSPMWTGPEPEEGHALWLGLPCSPCFARECPLSGEARLRCLNDIPVRAVLETLEQATVNAG